MSDQRDCNSVAIILAALAGGIIGAAAGIMLAPKPGKELRQDLSEKAKQTWDNLDIIDEGKELIHDLRQTLADFRETKCHTHEVKKTSTVIAYPEKPPEDLT